MSTLWDKKTFQQTLSDGLKKFAQVLTIDKDAWVMKDLIDVYHNLYTHSLNTKTLSRLIELRMLPIIAQFANRNNYALVLSEHQNHYPDISLISPEGIRVAIDLKSTYRTSETRVNGFTLGSRLAQPGRRRSDTA